ncbi:glycine cleavage system protein H [Carnobacteriaceae bacterium zg-ZUI252]|nr:glycine cleavage system protein H [Carnobacteriaceae bacterium zg-ZUI252]MBS4769551.1 glycine cleavage system protein H [Carnobacteriaceae bacterium zg-ZUI240]QTU83018.1 glycine cleavage system protein H [Carnobacteriaceae bacterium zg-C25]
MEKMMKYSENGFWVEPINDDLYRIGLSDKGQDDLGDVAFFEFLASENVTTEDSLFSVEASKATTDLASPLNGRVVEWHHALEKQPELLNSTDKENTWVAILSHVERSEYDALLDTSGL